MIRDIRPRTIESVQELGHGTEVEDLIRVSRGRDMKKIARSIDRQAGRMRHSQEARMGLTAAGTECHGQVLVFARHEQRDPQRLEYLPPLALRDAAQKIGIGIRGILPLTGDLSRIAPFSIMLCPDVF
jgi:hypothetical protein